MVDVESDYSSVEYKKEAYTGIDPKALQVFFDKHKLVSRESTFLFTISGDKDSLRKFSKDKDPFFSDNFRNACKSVLKDIHNVDARVNGSVTRQYNRKVAKLL